MALPSAYFCALTVPNIRELCDIIISKSSTRNDFHILTNCLEENEFAIASQYCQAFADALYLASRPPINNALFQAKVHCDLLNLVAGIANRNSKAMHTIGVPLVGNYDQDYSTVLVLAMALPMAMNQN